MNESQRLSGATYDDLVGNGVIADVERVTYLLTN